MALAPGATLGPYTVTAKIGEGGMGEVWEATDTQLNRRVALKTLPDAVADDADRLARFQREAQVLASLNHPGIGQIYGFELGEPSAADGSSSGQAVKALVLELVEGPTLADRIASGPIPVDEALPIATQIAEALEAAHAVGIIHRDLKPANIKVRADATVKVLDFGLAKAVHPERDPAAAADSPNISLTAAATQMGMVIGTAAYMAPEQAKGRPVDKRADVWALGAVLFEMLTGRPPFQGDDVSTTLARVIEREPDWTALPDAVSPVLRTFLTRCLAKDPTERLHDVADVRLALSGAFDLPAAPDVGAPGPAPVVLRVWQRPVPVALGGLALLAAGLLLGWRALGPPPAPSEMVRFSLTPPADVELSFVGSRRDLAITPDGSRVIYTGRARGSSTSQLYVRPVDELEGTPLRGTEGGEAPFVSPDGDWVGFKVVGAARLQKVPIFGGPPTLVADLPGVFGASWADDDQIVVGSPLGLFRVPADGGTPEQLTAPDSEALEIGHAWPSVIPGRQAVLFVQYGPSGITDGELAALDLDTGQVTRLGVAGMSPRYVSTGHLVFADGDATIRAAPFDLATLELTGVPVPVLDGVSGKTTGATNFDIAATGRLVYGTGLSAQRNRSVYWFSRDPDGGGGGGRFPLPRDGYLNARLSPDGGTVSVMISGPGNDLWTSSVERNTLSRLTSMPGTEGMAVWTPDGDRILFTAGQDGQQSLFSLPADGSGSADRLLTLEQALGIILWGRPVTEEGVLISYLTDRGSDIGLVSLTGEPTLRPVVETPASESLATLSPDGDWLAYQSDETGTSEIYVQRFPDGGDRRRVTPDGGTKPLWAPDGRTLYYARRNFVMAVEVGPGPPMTFGLPAVLFNAGQDQEYYAFGLQDISPDGERFLMLGAGSETATDGEPPAIHVVLDWTQELLDRVPLP